MVPSMIPTDVKNRVRNCEPALPLACTPISVRLVEPPLQRVMMVGGINGMKLNFSLIQSSNVEVEEERIAEPWSKILGNG